MKVKKEFLRASFMPSTFNEADNSVDVVFSTGSKVKRYSYSEGEFWEELSLKRGHVDLSRFKSGAPVLDNHGTAFFGGIKGLDDVIGKVESARVEKDKHGKHVGVAKIRLTNRPERAGVVQDIREGIITKLSIGYRVNKFEEQKERFEDLPVLRATDWEPMELSFVAIPADDGAQARSEPTNELTECELITTEGGAMGLKNKGRKGTQPPVTRTEGDGGEAPAEEVTEVVEEVPAEEVPAEEVPAEEVPAEEVTEEPPKEEGRSQTVTTPEVNADEIRKAEATRQDEIRKAVKLAKIEGSFADELCRNVGTSVEQARELIFKEMEKRTNNVTMNQRVEVKDMGQKELRRKAAVRGLLHRFNPSIYKMEEGDREFRTDSIIQTARNFLASEGVSNVHQLTKKEVSTRALQHSSDFPLVLADVSNKSLQDSYASAPATFMPFVSEKSVSDFKIINTMKLSDGGRLTPVNEHGEYERTALEESKESYKITKYGKIIGRTWELMINDDLGAFTDIAAKLGKRAREKESEIFWDLILLPQIMGETGLALYHATHNNLGTAGVIAIASLGEARQKMRTHLDLDGELVGGLQPRYLVTPAALETVGNQFLSQINPNQAGQVNPFSSNIQQIVEPRLDANSIISWYMMSDKSMVDMGELARLDGRGPEISVREGFEVDGMETKIRYVFGMRVLDYRGFFKNNGA